MRTIARAVALTALIAGSLLAISSPASAATITVRPGQSIQAAINRANPGDTITVAPGVYREALTIRKDNLKLIGSGDDAKGTVLRQPANPKGFCNEPGFVSGMCVIAKKLDENFNIVTPVVGVQISGFLVQGFSGDGIVSYGGDRLLFVNNTAERNGGYGITSFVSTGSVYDDLVARDNVGPGFYIGDTQNSDFTLKNSVATGNELGILVREANNGTLSYNKFEGNCVGILFLNHGGPPNLNVRVQNWHVHHNSVLSNNKSCDDPEAGGAFGGAGIVLGGTKGVTVEYNALKWNERVGNSPFYGGIQVVSTVRTQGGNVPVGNVVRNNVAFHNTPVDIFWDRTGTGNAFPNNFCGTSNPAWICAD